MQDWLVLSTVLGCYLYFMMQADIQRTRVWGWHGTIAASWRPHTAPDKAFCHSLSLHNMGLLQLSCVLWQWNRLQSWEMMECHGHCDIAVCFAVHLDVNKHATGWTIKGGTSRLHNVGKHQMPKHSDEYQSSRGAWAGSSEQVVSVIGVAWAGNGWHGSSQQLQHVQSLDVRTSVTAAQLVQCAMSRVATAFFPPAAFISECLSYISAGHC